MLELLEHVIHHLPDMAVIVFDWDYRYKICRGPLHERLGYSQERMEGRTMYEVINEKSWSLLEPLYERALHGEDFTVEFNGTELPDIKFWCDFAPIYRGSDVAYGMAIVRDITEETKVIEKRAHEQNIDFAQRVLGELTQAILQHIDALPVADNSADLLLSANNLLKIITRMQKQVSDGTI